MRLVLVGGNPKGHSVPFYEGTKSGKVLRHILDRHGIKPILFDLWLDAEEERKGELSVETLQKINGFIFAGDTVIALGTRQYRKLHPYFAKVQYLPHPASRRASDIRKLERGLNRFAK